MPFVFVVIPPLSSTESSAISARTSAYSRFEFLLDQRLVILAALLLAETLIFSLWFDNADIAGRGGLLSLLGRWGAWTARGAVGAAVIFFTFAYLRNKPALEALVNGARRTPIAPRLLAIHLTAMTLFAAGGWALYGNHVHAYPNLMAIWWLACGMLGLSSAAFALIPAGLWLRLLRATGMLAVYSALAVVPACIAGIYSQALWNPIARVTFTLVKLCLTPFAAGIVADPGRMVLGTGKFSVEIAPQCSGFEGVGLILAFGIIWLVMFRHECRFPQALLLIPAGIAAIYLLNAVRIAALILIGDAGAPGIAEGGFHSQAGWIAFNAVALGFCVAARRVPWLTTAAPSERKTGSLIANNPSATYLLPFLSILAAGVITTAFSADFEWLYPARFLAAAATLWALRRRYTSLDWKPGWFGPAIGVAVFGIWIAVDALLGSRAGDAMPEALAGSSSALRATWILFRVAAATVTVPIAEELAFRGFALRRLISAEFEALPARSFTWTGLAISSVAFGLLHGNLWLAGILAGLAYAWAFLRRGSIGAAVAAHATTNALLAAYVLLFQRWHLW